MKLTGSRYTHPLNTISLVCDPTRDAVLVCECRDAILLFFSSIEKESTMAKRCRFFGFVPLKNITVHRVYFMGWYCECYVPQIFRNLTKVGVVHATDEHVKK